jgi:hypothetical protein
LWKLISRLLRRSTLRDDVVFRGYSRTLVGLQPTGSSSGFQGGFLGGDRGLQVFLDA